MNIHEHNSKILESKPIEMGFTVGKNAEYAAIPLMGSDTQLMIIHQGKQIKKCRNRKSALKFIEDHRKGKSVAQLPIN